MTYPTDPPIRKLILDNVRTTLAAIEPGGGFRTTVKRAEHIGLNALDLVTYPFIAIGPPSFSYEDSQYRKMAVEMTITLLLVVRTSTEAVETMHDFLEDVSLALRADVTRGGYAIDTHIRRDTPAVPVVSEPVFSTEVEVAISYRYLATDPSTPL